MDQLIDTRVHIRERRVRSWRIMAGAFLVVTALAWFGGLAGPGRVDAQQPRRQREDPPSRSRMEFRQAEVVYTRMAEMIGNGRRRGGRPSRSCPSSRPTPASAGR
jgi:hypothetical protein